MAEESKSQLDLGLKKELDKLDLKEFNSLKKQVQTEYKLAYDHQKPKKDEALLRLKVYNNQRKDKEAVGDTTLFTTLQTVTASLYIDRLTALWGGRTEGDEDVADNLNAMAKFDYGEMGKDEIDYDWIWDAAFFGRGLVLMEEFIRDPDKKIFIPLPEVIDPLVFLRDPRAVSINGNRKGTGAARFFGWLTKMTKRDMEENPHFFNNINWDEVQIGGQGTQSLLADAASARDDSQGRQDTRLKDEQSLGPNAEYEVTIWYTWARLNGTIKRVKCWSSNERSKLLGVQELKFPYWTVFDRPLYPTSHDWDGTSIPDLVEDKNRARAVAQNLGLSAMKANLHPMYLYNSQLIKNRNHLNFGYNKFIPVDGPTPNAIAPLQKDFNNMQLLDFIYTTLDVSAQKATATPEIQQGRQSSEQRTLGELNLVASRVDTRYSLSAKVFGWSEKRFWRHWYQMYKEYFGDEVDEKVLRLVGAMGPKFRELSKKDIIGRLDPDVEIDSEIVSRAKQLEERQMLTAYFAMALQEPTSNRRWGLKKLAKLNTLEKDEVDRLFPPTIDERIAEDENDKLSDNEFTPVQREDDHNVHLEVHSKAKDSVQTYAHIETHKLALSIKKTNPELFPQEPGAANFQEPGTPELNTEGVQPEMAGQPTSIPPTAQPAPRGIPPS